MNIVAIIQARMSSTRLSNKVMLPLAGKPVLEHVVARVKFCKTLHKVVVATSNDSSDDPIERWCLQFGVACYRGSLSDVLDRYYQAATRFKADAIVRITADCPAIDPTIVDEVVNGYLAGDFDAYSLAGEFPDGLDCQVFDYQAIERAWREATLPSEREHVGPYIEKSHPELFKRGGLFKFQGLAHHRWTLDEPRDYVFLQTVFERLYQEDSPFSAGDILELLQLEPDLMKINGDITRNEGYLKSLQAEQDHHVQS